MEELKAMENRTNLKKAVTAVSFRSVIKIYGLKASKKLTELRPAYLEKIKRV